MGGSVILPPMKLNLASGTDLREGWVNLDVVAKWPNTQRGCDVIWDARKDPIPFPDDSAEQIYAGYLFLHLAPRFHTDVMMEIRRVLSPVGTLMVGEVDMDQVMKRWLDDPFSEREAELIWGEQGNEFGDDLAQYDKHCHGFTQQSLTRFLTNFGFVAIERTWIHQVYYELTLTCKKL